MSFKSERHAALEAVYPKPLTQRELDRHNREYHGFRPHWHQRGHTPISLHVRLRFVLALVAVVVFYMVAR